MSLSFYKFIAAILIFLISVVTILYPLNKKNTFKHAESASLGEALASGIFLGVAFFHMLPDAIKLFAEYQSHVNFPVPEGICVAGFLLLLFLERLSTLNNHHTSVIPYVLLLMLTIHALTEGAALGIGANASETLLIFIAILAHKMSESFALCMVLLRHQLSLRTVVIMIVLFSFMTPLGIFFGTLLNQTLLNANTALIAGIFNAFAAGTFLYISTLHHIHAHQHREEAAGLQEFACLLFGTLLMAGVAFWT